MAEHRFDPVAFVFGGLALAAGGIVLAGGELTDEGRVLLPGGLIALGFAVLVNVVRRDPRVAAAVSPTAAEDERDDHSDLDDLFAPVDDVLNSWPSEPAPSPDASGDRGPTDDTLDRDPVPVWSTPDTTGHDPSTGPTTPATAGDAPSGSPPAPGADRPAPSDPSDRGDDEP